MTQPAGDGRRILLKRFGPPDSMQIDHFEPTPPGPGEVQVHGAYAAINFADLMQRMGLYRAAPKLPFVPGFEVSGHVAAIGEGVEGVAVGDEVAAVTRFGGYTTHLNVPATNLFPIGDLDLQEAAAFPTVYLTAWEALVGMARARPGDRVLIHAGAGGVGLAAIGVAKHLGLDVSATTGTPAKMDVLRKQGATPYCTRNEAGEPIDWVETVRSDGRFDIVLEPGGPDQMRQSLRVLAPRGQIVMFGAQDVAPTGKRNLAKVAKVLWRSRFPLLSLVPRNAGISAFHLLYMWEQGVDLRASADDLLVLMRDKKIPRPHVDKVFPLAEVGDAHQYIHDRRNVGKVLLDLTA